MIELTTLQPIGWGALTGAAFALTFYAKAYSKEKESFSWKKFLPTVASGAVLGAVASVFNQDFEALYSTLGGFVGVLIVEIWKSVKNLFA